MDQGAPITPLDMRPVRRILRPFARFAELETSSSLVLLTATVAALWLANSPLHAFYEHILAVHLGASLGPYRFAWPFTTWVNDVLMAIFFLVVGLEVKRELLVGELASFRRAILPVLAALGGMTVPALIYLALNHGTVNQKGWGVPVATDIAFSLAILTSLGKRIPLSLRIFLASLAIADDLGGILVIAIAYTRTLHLSWLLATAGLTLVGLVMNYLGVVRLSAYVALGILLWVTLHASGIHPTIAGVVLALIVPTRSFLHPERFVERGHLRLERFRVANNPGTHSAEATAELNHLVRGLALVRSPLDRLEEALQGWVSFGIMPLFALTNAGIPFTGFHLQLARQPAFLGVALGLLLGKPIGVTLFSWLAVKLRIAHLPPGVQWRHLHGAAWVAGIGFTVAIFIAGLAFADPAQYTEIRIAILLASSLAALTGALLLRFTCPAPKEVGSPATH